MVAVVSPNIIFLTGPDTSPFPLNHARIGYQNFIQADMLTATSEDAGFPISSLYNPLTYDQYRTSVLPATINIDLGQTRDCDYMGLAAHNLSNISGVVSVEYSTDGGVNWTQLKEVSVGNNNPIMLIFSTITARYWRLVVSGTGTFRLGALYLGQALIMQRPMWAGHSPAPLSRKTEYKNNTSNAGQWLGRTIVRKGVGVEFEWNLLTSEWYRTYFDPFVKSARSTPFFIAWNPERYPNEVAYCWTNKDIKPVNSGPGDMMSVSFSAEGYSDD